MHARLLRIIFMINCLMQRMIWSC